MLFIFLVLVVEESDCIVSNEGGLVTVKDVPAGELIPAIAEHLKKNGNVKLPKVVNIFNSFSPPSVLEFFGSSLLWETENQ